MDSRNASQPRIRQSDGAVLVRGIGYVTALPTLGGREQAAEAARQAIETGRKQQGKWGNA